MHDGRLLDNLEDQSTWRLLGLGVITYGVYFAYYIKKQTAKINNQLEGGAVISEGFIMSIIVMSYVSLTLFILYFVVEEGHVIETANNIADRLYGILLIVWGFKARNRLNALYAFDKESEQWFHGLWTFLFTPLYFNYKVNTLNEISLDKLI